MVEKHIKSLLYDHDCVIIPDFGGLIARYVPARINPVKHTLQPPSKTIAFNEKLVLNDGLLISTIAYHNKISKEEAQALVANFVHTAKNALHQHNQFELSNIGVFRYSAERRLVFEYVEGDNMLEESFGLPELVARPLRVQEPAVLRTLIKERQQELVDQKQPLRKRIKRAYHLAAGLALAGMSVSALYFLSLQADYNMSSLNPVMLFNTNQSASTVSSPVDRYAADYVPFTDEERSLYYAVMLPKEGAAVEADETELLTEENILVDSTSMALVNNVENAAAEDVAIEQVAPEKEEEAKMPAHIVNANDGRFYIITGGYVRLENAEESRAAIRKDGGNVKVVLPGPGSRLYRVAVADFDTKEEAQAELSTYRKKFGETLWVLTN